MAISGASFTLNRSLFPHRQPQLKKPAAGPLGGGGSRAHGSGFSVSLQNPLRKKASFKSFPPPPPKWFMLQVAWNFRRLNDGVMPPFFFRFFQLCVRASSSGSSSDGEEGTGKMMLWKERDEWYIDFSGDKPATPLLDTVNYPVHMKNLSTPVILIVDLGSLISAII